MYSCSFSRCYSSVLCKDRRKDEELEDATITMPEMARLLGIPRRQVYEILKNSKYSHFFETIVIAEKKRITKESFQKFLDGQDHYKLDPANDYEELSMEQNFSLANYRRKKLAKTGDRSKNGNLGYLTFDEAAFLAKVSRGMIYKWIDDGKFSSVNEYVSASTVRDIHKLLRNCFEQAIKWEMLEKNPCIYATVPKHKSQKRETWTAETLMYAMDVCEDQRLKLAINLSFSCSMRLGELLGLTWDCVDISLEAIEENRAYVYINKETQWVKKESLKDLEGKDVLLVFLSQHKTNTTVQILKTPKTESSIRKVFLPKSVANMLVE